MNRTKDHPHQMKILKERMTGEKNPQYKGGDDVEKSTLHSWMRRRIPKPKKCPHCKVKPPLDLANLKQHQYTRDPKDYMWLCRGCHMKLDGRKPPQWWKDKK